MKEQEEPRKIWYSEIMELGFEVEECRDDVYEKQHGYPYRIISKKLTKDVFLEYNMEERECVAHRCNKDGDTIGSIRMSQIEPVKAFIQFYKKNK